MQVVMSNLEVWAVRKKMEINNNNTNNNNNNNNFINLLKKAFQLNLQFQIPKT